MNEKDILFFDIETTADQQAIYLLDDPIARQDIEPSAPLDADYSQVKAIGYCMGTNKEDIKTLVVGEVNVELKSYEDEVIRDFWTAYTKAPACCGFNILNFDLPYLMRRSLILNIKPGKIPSLVKFRPFPNLDLFQLYCNWNPFGCKGKNLKWIAKRLGLEILAEDVSGADVKTMSNEAVAQYVKSDVWLTIQLYQRMQGVFF